MKKLITIILLSFGSLLYSVELTGIVDVGFSSNKIEDHQELRNLITFNEEDIVFEQIKYFNFNDHRIGYKVIMLLKNPFNVQNENFCKQLDVSQVRYLDDPKSAFINHIETMPESNFNAVSETEILSIKKIFMEWSSGGTSDVLVYAFSVDSQFVDKIYIQFNNTWGTFNEWSPKLNFEMVSYIPDDNPTKTLFTIIERSVKDLHISIPILGIFTDSSVRVRESPNLDSEILGNLDEGTIVQVLSQSSNKQVIQNMDDYWYHIRQSNGLTGWSYGHFIEIPECLQQ